MCVHVIASRLIYTSLQINKRLLTYKVIFLAFDNKFKSTGSLQADPGLNERAALFPERSPWWRGEQPVIWIIWSLSAYLYTCTVHVQDYIHIYIYIHYKDGPLYT